MDAVKRALLFLAACGDLKGFGGDVPPLATIHAQVSGALPADLQLALVWGKQWLVEALCILPPENADAQAVLAAGCRDPFGFIPSRVTAVAPVNRDGSATFELEALPDADLLVGDLTARVGYASLVAFEDLNHTGTLELGRPNRLRNPGPDDMGPPMDMPTVVVDKVDGASFVTMTAPDTRIGFREGAFSAVAAFYPRHGCGDPPTGFSVLRAGGFTAQSAIDATLAGMLPAEDPASCDEATLDSPIAVPLATGEQELACGERAADSSVRYNEPEQDHPPDLTNRLSACVHLPSFGDPSPTVELIVTGRSDDSCVGLSHFVLKGCDNDPGCAMPDWDHTAAPPDWWPCAQ